jgi:hypothetical protein
LAPEKGDPNHLFVCFIEVTHLREVSSTRTPVAAAHLDQGALNTGPIAGLARIHGLLEPDLVVSQSDRVGAMPQTFIGQVIRFS